MLNLITIDRIFEESWKTYTDDNPYDNRDFITIYLEGLKKEVSLRTERTLPRLDAFVEAVKPLVGDGALSVSSNGFNVSFADQSFSVIERKPGWFVLNALKCHFSADVSVWVPQEAALLMWAAGNYRQKAGKRWDEYFKAKKEQERIKEIEAHYHWERKSLIERCSNALVSGEAADTFQDEFTSLLQNTAKKKGVSLTEAETDCALKAFAEDAEKARKAILRRKMAAEKAREKRLLEKEKAEQRYKAEMEHLIKAVGIVPVVSLHKPFYRPHYQEYCFTLSNGKSIKVRDYDKRPSKVEKEALRLIRNLNKD